MAELRLDCPSCNKDIVVKLQSEVFITDTTIPRRGVLPPPTKPMLYPPRRETRRPRSFEKIIVYNRDGTTREITQFDELYPLFFEFDDQQHVISTYTDEQLQQAIEKLQALITRRKEQRPHQLRGWRGLARTLSMEKRLGHSMKKKHAEHTANKLTNDHVLRNREYG
jgi:hypothetical protein